jgi:pimeloyl-ACP methyl ester carboxylesterase
LNWDADPGWRPTFYDAPVITHRQDLAPASIPEEAAIHTIDRGSLVIPAYLAPETGDTLTVMFHGAIHRGKTRVPIFQRLSSQLDLQAGPTLAFADPTLDLAAELRIGWYLGHEGIDLPAHLAETIRTVAERLGTKKLVLGGNSGGGFAALQVSAFLPESTVVAFSPQTDLREYFAVPSRMAYEAAFGRRRAPTLARHRARISVLERLKATRQIGRVVLVSNPGDELHVKAHEKPLLAALARLGTSEARVEEIDMGQGHKAPSAETYERVMRRVYAEL